MNAATLFLITLTCSHVLGTPQVRQEPPYPSNQFTIVNWNVDSLKPDPHMAALRMARMEGVDLWGICGVRNEQWAEMFRAAAGENEPREVASLLSPTCGTDRLLILYDSRRFELIRHYEFGWEDEPWYRPDMVLRPSLVAQLRHRATGQEFLFMVNCLHPKWTALQAEKIARWARRQGLPIIAAGTYYFQYNLGAEPLRCDGQPGFAVLQDGGVFLWVTPQSLIRTYDSPYNTIEDFVFIANVVGKLYACSQIIVNPDDFAGREPTGAHRPIQTTVTIVAPMREALLRRRIYEQALRVKSELHQLEALVRQLPE